MNGIAPDLKLIFGQAVEIESPTERAAYLDEACGRDSPLRSEVERLLLAAEQAGSFMDGPAVARDDTQLIPNVSERAGTIIGPYKLLEQIGEGGMGVVFMAEQTVPIQRTVALKIIKPGMDTRQVIARFEAERQALAMMDHPNIARVIDAGTTDAGRPYFVMELVKGLPITKYCDDKQLSLRERLELLLPVCQAVQHAHQKGIIHRDLKPTNVLIAEYDNHAVPKIIDFGVAKATAQKLTERTMFTEFGQVIGTVEYMSPEQAKFNQLDIDTRSDIYSLGVLLYELLAGSTPFERTRMREAAFDEVLRIIREEEPPKPSTRLSTSDTLPSIAARRHIEPKQLTNTIRGELDWIVMRTLEKDRQRRYPSADALADDLKNYLNDQPVSACPPSGTYRFKKFIRRNKVVVMAGAAVVMALVVGATLAAVGFVQARRQAQVAGTEATRSKQVAQFLKETLAATGPSVARGRDTTLMREVLEKTVQRVEKDLPNQPDVQGDLWMTLGRTYGDLGDYPRACIMLQRAVDNYRLLGDENTKLALALGWLGNSQTFSKKFSDGKTNAELGLIMARRCGDPETLATCLFNMARSLGQSSGEPSTNGAGIPYLREAIDLRKRQGTNPLALADCMYTLSCEFGFNEIAQSEALTQQALAIYREHLPADHPDVAGALQHLGAVYLTRQKNSQAETVLRESVELSRKVFPPDHLRLYRPTWQLTQALMRNGKWNEAETVLIQATENYPTSRDCWRLRCGLYAYQRDWTTAVTHAERAVKANPTGRGDLFSAAIILLEAGSRDAYLSVCHRFLELAATNHDFHSADMAAKVALLLPVEGADFQRACQTADQLQSTVANVEANENTPVRHWMGLLAALAAYRQGQYDSAKKSAAETVAAAASVPPCRAAACFIQAAACARLKDSEAAKAAFDSGNSLLTRADSSRDIENWPDYAIAEHLRREAAELLSIKLPTPQSPSHTDPIAPPDPVGQQPTTNH